MRLYALALAVLGCAACAAPAAAVEREPVNNSFIAFTVPEKDLLAENVAYDPGSGAFFVGSTRKGKIVRRDRNGRLDDFAAPRQDGLWSVIGMKVDAKRRLLWVCSTGTGGLESFAQGDGNPAGVFVFNIDTGNLKTKLTLDESGVTHFFNDIVLTADGGAFVTHMFDDAAVYRVTPGAERLEVFARPEGMKDPNGIALSADERTLFVAADAGILVIDTATRQARMLEAPENEPLRGIDGIYFHEGSLVAVHLTSVRRHDLDKTLQRVSGTTVLEESHPMFNVPTTGVLVGDDFYYLANSQFDSYDEAGSLFPLDRLYEAVVLRVRVRQPAR